jgi:phosphatidylserine/phosphatidylglycerophosphate/cardiolipin synthase-like enzyme
MSDDALLAAIARIAAELPVESAERLAAGIGAALDAADADARTAGLIASPRFAERRNALFAAWSASAAQPAAVALALRAAARGMHQARLEVRVEPVWTGPADGGTGFRRTEQVLLELIRLAQHRLLLVSYAVYRHPVLRGALVEAADRGVDLQVVVESPKESDGRMSADALKGLGARVVARSSVFVWPADKRPKDPSGRAGVLHAKCALADRDALLVSSANLTERAMTSNIELGLLVRGGPLPGRVGEAFDRLKADGALVLVPAR